MNIFFWSGQELPEGSGILPVDIAPSVPEPGNNATAVPRLLFPADATTASTTAPALAPAASAATQQQRQQ